VGREVGSLVESSVWLKIGNKLKLVDWCDLVTCLSLPRISSTVILYDTLPLRNVSGLVNGNADLAEHNHGKCCALSGR